MVGGQHEVVGQREEDREQEAGQRQDHRGPQEPAESQTVRHGEEITDAAANLFFRWKNGLTTETYLSTVRETVR